MWNNSPSSLLCLTRHAGSTMVSSHAVSRDTAITPPRRVAGVLAWHCVPSVRWCAGHWPQPSRGVHWSKESRGAHRGEVRTSLTTTQFQSFRKFTSRSAQFHCDHQTRELAEPRMREPNLLAWTKREEVRVPPSSSRKPINWIILWILEFGLELEPASRDAADGVGVTAAYSRRRPAATVHGLAVVEWQKKRSVGVVWPIMVK